MCQLLDTSSKSSMGRPTAPLDLTLSDIDRLISSSLTFRSLVSLKGADGWMNQAYSRLSTTHGHMVDCKLDSVVYAGVSVMDLSCLGRTIYARQFFVRSHRFNSATGEQKGITQTIYTDSEPPSRMPNSLMPRAKLRSANLPFFVSLM